MRDGSRGGRRGGGEMKKDAQEKMFPRMANRIMVYQFDWLVTSASQRIKRGLIHMTTMFPLFLFHSLCFFHSLFLPVCLIALATHHGEIEVESQSTRTCILILSLLLTCY